MIHENGMSNEEIAVVTGQKASSTVQRYIRTSNNNLKRASNCLSAGSSSAPKEHLIILKSIKGIEASIYSVYLRVQPSQQEQSSEIQQLQAL